ncbi:Cupin 1 [Macleaya cordata]|uniref:Cupin 1 n=1 Tax=Macleaya cordata TaxID=56857 RepID=A0A200QYF6_MACCD|nr:Cupin 1 [Macleaya cordata]
MATKTNFPVLFLFLLSLLFLSLTLSFCSTHHDFDNDDKDQNLKHCRQKCQEKQPYQQKRCIQDCEEQYGETKWNPNNLEYHHHHHHQDPEREYKKCQTKCQLKERGQQQQKWCEQRCEDRRREQEKKRGQYEEQQQQQQKNNPYFFDEQSFNEWYRTQEGNIRVLQRFSKRSNLLRGIENYRIALLEANPRTFVIPSYFDAEAVFFVVKGRGTMSLVSQDSRETFNLERGDVIRVPAGTSIHTINRDNKEKLQIAGIYQSISIPGRFRDFIGLAGEDPESFYKSFSSEILEASFNTPKEKIDRLFSQQKKGIIIKASEEQIRALSEHASEHTHHEGSSSSGPFNLLNKSPLHSNRYGKLLQIDGNDYKQLQDLDMSVSFTNITKGGMMAPFYNSKSTRMVLVVEGKGYFEMACPHLSRERESTQQGHSSRRGREQEQEQEEQGGGGSHYQRVSSRLSPRTLFIIPAGHPTTIVASDNENLQMVVFGINARNNKKNFLAGSKNIMNQMAKEAKELGFNIPAKEVEETFNNQKESFFLPGPHQRQQQREEEEGLHRVPLTSIFDFVAF